MSERARALEQALRELTAMVRGECPSLLNEDSGGNGDLSYQIEKLLAVDPPPSGASPQATGGYIHHSLTDWIPTPECDCDRCTSARKSAPKPTGGASPQAETSAHVRALTVHICEDCLNLRGEMCNEPGCRFCRRTMAEVADYLDALLIRPRIDGVSVLVDEGSPLSAPNSPPETSDLHLRSFDIVQAWLSECQKPGCHPCFECSAKLHAIVKGLLANQPAPVSPVEPESSSFEANTASNLLQKVELSTLDRYRNTNQMDVDTWMVRAVASSEPRSEDDLVLLDHVIALLKPTVEPEPPTLEPCAHELDYHNCAECVGPKVEPEPCVWRVTGGSLGWWVKPSCREGSIPAPWGTEKAVACHLCGAPLKVEREP